MSAPKPVEELRRYVERQQAAITDPAERVRAMRSLRREVLAVLSVVEAYLNDSAYAAQAAQQQPDQAPPSQGDGTDVGRDETP